MNLPDKLPGSDPTDSKKLTAMAGGAAIVAGTLTRSLVAWIWRRAKDEDPPRNPASPSTDWGDAIAWTLAVSVAVGTARLLARRGATGLYERTA